MLSAVKPRRREGRWPAKLQHSALFQIDQALLYLKAPALVSAALEAQGVSEGHVPTRLVWAALRNIKGLQVHPVLWHKMAKATNCAIAINRSGESFFLLADKDQPGTWQVTMNAFDGRLLLSEVGPLAELAKRFEWIDTLWVMNVATNKPNMSQWPQDFVTAPFWHHRREALLILGCGVVVTMLGVITPLGFQALMDKVLPFRASSSLAVVLVMLTLAIFSSSIVEAVHGYLESVMSARLQQRLGFDVFQRLLHMSVDFFDSRPAGEITKLASQINEVAHFQCQQLLSSAVAGLSLVVVLPLLLIYSTSLTMLVLAVGLTMAMTIIFSLKIYQRRVARAYSLDADFQSGLIELIKGIRTIKSLTLERHFYHQQSVRLENQLFGIFDVERLGLFLRAIVGFQSRIVSVLILGVGANAAFKGDFSIGQLIAFYMLSDRLIQPVMSLVMTVNGWQGYRLAKLKLSELHPSASQNQSIIPRRIVDSDYNLDGDICFENVWFRYPNSDIDVLKGITLTIPKGQMLGIVGESGSGKSTLFSLLQGFYAPTKGVIRIGGIDLRDIPPEVTREHMGLVSQSSFLFNQSVFENVRLGRLNSTSNDVLQALEQAECLSFVEEMPSRYGTLLSEDGLNLSGGQRQRLAIARAFLRDAPFMLFDEATSALDRGTEESIKLAVRKVCEGKTALLIAHRWSTLADCDQIVEWIKDKWCSRACLAKYYRLSPNKQLRIKVQYDFADIHVQHVLSADPEERKRFNVPRDLAIAAGWVISALILALVAAIVMHVDKIVPARGILETPLGVFTIRNMQAGYIKNLLVREGDSVTKGQTLVEFDSRMIELEIDKIKTDKEVAAREAWADALLVIPQLAKKDRQILNQRLSHIEKPITMHGFDSRLIHYTNEVQSVFTANRQAIASKLHDLDAQLRLQQQSLVLQKAELEKLEILVIDGFQSHSSLLSKQRAYLDMQATEQGLKADITGFRGELSRLDRDQSKQLAELAMNQLRGIDSAIGAYERSETQLAALEKTLDRMSVKAPFAGTVDHIFLKGEGEYVNDDVGLINLRQNLSSKELEIDIILPGSLAIWVKPGMNFRAFAANNNPEDHGYLKGEITFFAQSTQDVKDVLSYRLKGRIKEFVLKPGISKEALIRPGMDLRVEIITGTRSVMSYLLDPIQKTLRETMTEPN